MIRPIPVHVRLAAVLALCAVLLGVWSYRVSAPPARPKLPLLLLRDELLDETRDLHATQMQRFVPPTGIYAADGTLSGQKLLDQYSLTLEHKTGQLHVVAQIGVGLALFDFATATDLNGRLNAGTRVTRAIQDLTSLLDEIPDLEGDVSYYRERIQVTLSAIKLAIANPAAKGS